MPETYVEALYPYQAAEKNQISLHPHEKIQVLEKDDSGWWIGRNSQGNLGIFPSTYVKELKMEKVFNKPKEMKPLPVAPPMLLSPTSSSPRPLSREAKLASDLGFDIEKTELSDDEAPPRNDEEVQQLKAELVELKRKLQIVEEEGAHTASKVKEFESEAAECRKKEEFARTQLNVLKKSNIVLHENNRRLGQEVQDLKAELEAEGRTPPEVKYECTPDEAIERFLTSSLGTLRQEHEELRAKLEALQQELDEARSVKSQNGVADRASSGAKGGEGVDPEEFEKLRTKYKRLEKEYKILRKENAELKEGGAAAPANGVDNSAHVEKYKAKIHKLQEELEAAKAAGGSSEPSSNKDDSEELKAKLQKLDKKRKAEIQALQEALQKAQEDVAAMTQVNEELIKAKAELLAQQGSASTELQELREASKRFEAQVERVQKERQAEIDELTKRYKREEKLRRQLFNELQELKGNIRVFCRLKPCSPEEAEANGGVATTPEDGALKVVDDSTGKQHTFEFDAVYGPKATQEQIFNDVKTLATSVLDGYNVCIFAYGQTGSGKTYTMEGPPHDRGVNFRTVQDMFGLIANRQAEYASEVKIAVIEVYNEQIYDLLGARNKLDVRFTEKGGVQVPDMVLCTCKNDQEVMDTLYRGYECRKTASTNMNEHSSRSHCILSVYVYSTNLLTNVQTMGKLHLVDLAGSERLQRTGATEKERVDEAKNINSSLTHLGIVINALANKRDHIPYRNSALTKLLQDSLGGNCKCMMFANISMLGINAPETISTLKFAAGARQVELGKAEANKVKKKKPEDPKSPV